MEAGAPAEERAIVHRHVAAEEAIVRDDHVVADRAVMPEVRAGHEEVAVTEAGR